MHVQQSVPATGAGLQPQRFVCPGASNWGGWDPGAAIGESEPNYWRDPPCTYTHIIFSLVSLHPAQSIDGNRMRPFGAVFVWVLQARVTRVASHVHVVCMYALCACAGWEYIISLATVGPGATAQQQPCVSQAAGSGIIRFPLTNTINTKLLFVCDGVTGQKPVGGTIMEKGRKRETTHLCIDFPGASFTRTPFSTGFPSFPDGLFVSGQGGSKFENGKQKDTKVSFQS